MYVTWGQELRTKEKEEEARRRRGGGGGKKTRKWKLRVMTLAVRPKTLSYYNVCVCGPSVGGMRSVCAARLSLKLPGYALGMRRETVASNLH